jgi:hypothetical protein
VHQSAAGLGAHDAPYKIKPLHMPANGFSRALFAAEACSVKELRLHAIGRLSAASTRNIRREVLEQLRQHAPPF